MGNSIEMCMGIHWGLIERGKHYNIMKGVQGFSQCSAVNDKFIWNEDDSVYGIDVPAWKQTIHEAECNDKECERFCKEKYRGAFVKGVNKHVCYSYDILDSICIVIKYDKLRDEYIFHGGCFPGNKIYKMVPANPGEENAFNGVEIEIRDLSDPIAQAGDWTDYEYNLGHFWRYVSALLKLIALGAIILLGYVAYDVYHIKKKYKGVDFIQGEDNGGGQTYGFEP